MRLIKKLLFNCFKQVAVLEKETEYFNASRRKFLTLYGDKFIVIVGRRVMGVYDSHSEAYTQICKTHAVGTFIICNAAS